MTTEYMHMIRINRSTRDVGVIRFYPDYASAHTALLTSERGRIFRSETTDGPDSVTIITEVTQ
jgi:hypothetical protein